MKTTTLRHITRIIVLIVLSLALMYSNLPVSPWLATAPEQVYAQADEEIPANWLALAQETIQHKEYQVSWVEKPLIAGAPASFQAPNRAHNLRFYFQADGLQVIQRETNDPAWVWRLALAGVGRAGATMPLGQAGLVAEENSIRYQFEAMEQELVNDEMGLQQILNVFSQPEGDGNGPLVISQQSDQDFTIQRTTNGGLQFSFQDKPVLEYKLLSASDASGRALSVELQVKQGTIEGDGAQDTGASQAVEIVVDDNRAQYPLQIQALLSAIDPAPDWYFAGSLTGANFGYSVATAGDVNGDGYSDMIIGAPGFDFGSSSAGLAAVFYGSPTGPRWDDFDWEKYGSSSEASRLGTSVATAGDVNADGYSDVIIGAPEADSDPYFDNGEVIVYHGSHLGLSDSSAWVLTGYQSEVALGTSVATAGDLNNDGYSDVVVGAPEYEYTNEKSGAMYVQYGSSTGLPAGVAWAYFGVYASDYLGYSVATAGDVNGDGYADLLVGAPYADTNETFDNDAGKAFLYLGSGSTTARSPYKTFNGENGGDHLGWSVSTAGDVNGDGYADIIIGAPRADIHPESVTAEGEAYVFHGHPEMDTIKDWLTRGDDDQGKLGWSVATAGDVNADGYGDVIIGWPYFDDSESAPDEGRALLFLGGVTGLGTSLYSDPDSADWIADGNASNAMFGYSVATAGDVNGDGWSDLLVGSMLYTGASSNEGRAYLYYGGWVNLSDSAGWSYTIDSYPEGPDSWFGYSVASAGDVDADGYADILIGAPAYDTSYTNGGAAFLFIGGSGAGISWNPVWYALGSQANAYLGWSVASAGDVNGDGYSDVIIGAPYMDNTQQDEGMAFVYLGSSSGLGTNSTYPVLDADWYAESNWAVSYLGAAVASAGDVNGDGYSDIVIGAPYCNRYTSVSEPGHVLVWHGSASGLGANGTLDNPDWRAIGNYAGGRLGSSVSSAGDVNRDGFSDVIAGGLAFAKAWYGAPYGLHKITASFNQDWIIWGPSYTEAVYSASGVGDINGDGYSDVAFGTPYYSFPLAEEGAVYAYCGSASGLPGYGSAAPVSACWYDYGNDDFGHLGRSVSGAGDVNGDGYADIIAGAPDFSNPTANEGQARVYYGASGGPILNSHGDWKVEGNTLANLGIAVASAGDTNGDGFADVLVGAHSFDNDGGKAELYYGNGAPGKPFLLKQMQSDSTTNLHNLGGVSNDLFYIRLVAYNPAGRALVRAVYEIKNLGTNFTGTSNMGQTSYYDTGTSGAPVLLNNTGFPMQVGVSYHWRVRLRSLAYSSPFAPPYSRWMHIPWSGWNEADLRRPAYLTYLPLLRK